jgi:hypothetical protein
LEDIDTIRVQTLVALAFRHHWSSVAESILKYHTLMQERNGKATRGRGKSGWGIRETADDLKISLGMTNDYIRLAKVLKDNPLLKEQEFRDVLSKLRKARR